MLANDVLRQIRYIFDYSDGKMADIFRLAGLPVKLEQLSTWLRKEDEAEFVKCKDEHVAFFLNGLIVEKRGKKEGAAPPVEKHLSNNMILNKLKIALSLRSDDMMTIYGLVEVTISKHELSAFFRKPGHKHYRECLDQLLRKFLLGMKLRYRDNLLTPPEADAPK